MLLTSAIDPNPNFTGTCPAPTLNPTQNDVPPCSDRALLPIRTTNADKVDDFTGKGPKRETNARFTHKYMYKLLYIYFYMVHFLLKRQKTGSEACRQQAAFVGREHDPAGPGNGGQHHQSPSFTHKHTFCFQRAISRINSGTNAQEDSLILLEEHLSCRLILFKHTHTHLCADF